MKSILAKGSILVAAAVTGLLFVPPLGAAKSSHGVSIASSSKHRVSTTSSSKTIPKSPKSSKTAPSTKQVSARATLPVRLMIPSIHVNAAIQYVGLTSTGAMGVPNGRSDVAWYDRGPRPGEVGSAVIAGHTAHSGPATVFDNLSQLRPGDLIYVQNRIGAQTAFVVRSIHVYSPNAQVPEVFTSSSGTHLNLITCTGVWDTAKNGFTKRMVVFADLKI